MRNKHRVPIIIEALKNDENKRKVLNYLFKPEPKEQMAIDSPFYYIDTYVDIWKEEEEKFVKMYSNYPNLRLTQILVNCNIIPNYPGSWYYTEDVKLMIESEVLAFEEISFWTIIYDKNGELIDRPIFKLLKDMEEDHIKAILKDVENKKLTLSSAYEKYFKERIKDSK